MVACLDAVAVAAERRPQLYQRLGELEPGAGLLEPVYGLAQQRDALCPWGDGTGGAGCCAERARQAGGAREVELLGGEALSLVVFAELGEGERGVLAPGGWAGAAQALPALTRLAQLAEALA